MKTPQGNNNDLETKRGARGVFNRTAERAAADFISGMYLFGGGGIKVLSQSKDEHRGHSKDFTKERQVREAASLLPFILLKSTFGHLT